MEYLKKYNENINPFEEDDWDFEEHEEDFIDVEPGYQFKKGDIVKLKKDSRFRGPVDSRKGTIINKQGKTPYPHNRNIYRNVGDDWWIVEWEIEGRKLKHGGAKYNSYSNCSNYPTTDLLIHYGNMDEDFNFNEDDFDYEEEPTYDTDDYIKEFLNPKDTCVNHNGDRIGNVIIEVSPYTWDAFVDGVKKYNRDIRWVNEIELNYSNMEHLINEFPNVRFGDFFMLKNERHGNQLLYYRMEDKLQLEGNVIKYKI